MLPTTMAFNHSNLLFSTLRLLVPVESNNLLQFGLNPIFICMNKREKYHWEWNQGTE